MREDNFWGTLALWAIWAATLAIAFNLREMNERADNPPTCEATA